MPKPKYANQRTVKIDRKTRSNHPFATFDKDLMADACKVLNGSGFKVWCYLLSNQDGYEWAISPAHAEATWGIPTSTFKDGIRELKEKGFIVDGCIHQQRIKNEDEIRLQNKVDENRQEDTKSVLLEDENHISNINNNINNINNYKDTSSKDAGSILQHPEEENTITESFLKEQFGDYWFLKVDEGYFTFPNGTKAKVILGK